MTLRPGLFGGSRRPSEPDVSASREDDRLLRGPADEPATVWLGAGAGSAPETQAGGFDPVWGNLSPRFAPEPDPWATAPVDEAASLVDVEVVGNGFQMAGKIKTGQFERLSDWLNRQQGFINLRDATLSHPGHDAGLDGERTKGMLWVRLDQVVIVAQHGAAQPGRSNAPRVNKERRKVTVVTPGYTLRGYIYLIADGSMQQFLESPDPHFLPMTDLVVRWLMDETLVSHHAFALINREQIISVFEEPAKPDGGASERDDASHDELRSALGLRERGVA